MSFKPYLNSDDLIESVKRKIAFPLSQETFNEEDILHFANEELMSTLVPQILSYHEEFFVFSEDIPLVEGVTRYPIPARAIGMKLRDIFYKDSNGNLYEMTRIDASNKDYYQRALTNIQNVNRYYFENNDIILAPYGLNSVNGFLYMQYFLRPNMLVPTVNAAIVTSIVENGVDNTKWDITFDQIPSNIAVGTKVDFLQMEAGHKLFKKDYIFPTNVGTTITIPKTDLPDGFVVGDYICEQYQCIVPQIPDDLHSGLADRVCGRILHSISDFQGLSATQAKINEGESRQTNVIDNRCEGSPQKLFNRHSIVRFNKKRYMRY